MTWVLHRPTELSCLFRDKLCYDFVLSKQIIKAFSQKPGMWTKGRWQTCWMKLIYRSTALSVWCENQAGGANHYPYLRQSAVDTEFLDVEFDLVFKIAVLSAVWFECSVTHKSTCMGFFAWEIAEWLGTSLNFSVCPPTAGSNSCCFSSSHLP